MDVTLGIRQLGSLPITDDRIKYATTTETKEPEIVVIEKPKTDYFAGATPGMVTTTSTPSTTDLSKGEVQMTLTNTSNTGSLPIARTEENGTPPNLPKPQWVPGLKNWQVGMGAALALGLLGAGIWALTSDDEPKKGRRGGRR